MSISATSSADRRSTCNRASSASVSKAEVALFPKQKAMPLRLPEQDNEAIAKAAASLVTECLTKSALMVAGKVAKQ